MSGPQTETTPDSDAGTDATDSTTYPRNSAIDTSSSDLDLLMTVFTSGRISRKEYIVYRKLHDKKKLSKITFNATAGSHTTSSAVSQVFNSRELLEMILLNIKSVDLFTNVRWTCRGLKNSIDTSETLSRRPVFAT
jgi:hypothetical protein